MLYQRERAIKVIRTSPFTVRKYLWQPTVSLLFALATWLATSPANADELLVSAAISLRESFVTIGQEFERKHPGQKITFNFASSGQLAQQIERGAPVDVFASASYKEAERLRNRKMLMESTIHPFARNRLVVIVPQDGKAATSLQELLSLAKISIGNPQTVPAGAYAMEALNKANIYTLLSSQHKLILAESVRQTLSYVESADVDAGIVYSTDALLSKKVKVEFVIPESYTETILYPIGLVSDSKHVKLGLSFIEFVRSPISASILRGKGFLPVGK